MAVATSRLASTEEGTLAVAAAAAAAAARIIKSRRSRPRQRTVRLRGARVSVGRGGTRLCGDLRGCSGSASLRGPCVMFLEQSE